VKWLDQYALSFMSVFSFCLHKCRAYLVAVSFCCRLALVGLMQNVPVLNVKFKQLFAASYEPLSAASSFLPNTAEYTSAEHES
jgi:hypothetical protein